MRVLRALTLMLLMLHVVPVGAMRTYGSDSAHAGHAGSEHCAYTSPMHQHHRDSCGNSSAATCCEGVSCASYGVAAVVMEPGGLHVVPQRTPAGPRAQALLRSSTPETPPPKA
jgi:hypothetical protein